MNEEKDRIPVYTGDFIRTTELVSLDRNAPLWKRLETPSQYRPNTSLVDAVNTALALRQPLLLTGETGVGKTQLAVSLAAELHARYPDQFHSELLRFETKSTSIGRDLFYDFDALGRLYATKEGVVASPDPLNYLTWAALGKAIILASPDNTDLRRTANLETKGVIRSIVLIDEIDKAPRDLPNDVLNEIAAMKFSVREHGGLQLRADRNKAPVVVITSNSEKQLPDPFLRRCVYHHIDFPSGQLAEIANTAIAPPGGQDGALMREAISLFEELRGEDSKNEKQPGLSEFLTWLEVITLSNPGGRSLSSDLSAVKRSLGVLFKTKTDLERGPAAVDAWARSKFNP